MIISKKGSKNGDMIKAECIKVTLFLERFTFVI